MPCYSRIQTKLIDLVTIQKAAKDIGANIIAQSPNNIVIEKGDTRVALERSHEGENYSLMTSRSSWGFDNDNLLDELTKSYAKTTLKTWAQKNGYQFSAGKKSGEYVMTQYTGK